MNCKSPGCTNTQARDRLCWSHYKRRRNGQDEQAPLREYESLEPKDALLREAVRYTHAEGEDEFKLRERLLISYATKYVLAKLGASSFAEALARMKQ